MFEHLRPSDSLVWTILWQSSAFLALGLAMSLVLRKRPARAHWVLLSAMLAALASPALTETGRRLGWGLWATPAPVVEAVATTTTAPPIATVFHQPAPPPSFFEAPRSVEVAPVVEPIARPSLSWRSAFLLGWAAASLFLFARLLASFVGGWRLARSAREVDDSAVRAWVESAADRLGLRAVPRVGRLSAVRCPAVWCWGRRPLLLLPEEGRAEGVDWAGVFRHELAHWSRRDHISMLLAELLVCALPWQPLAWWSRGRLAQLAELACDDWVLADGVSPADYAESLLALTPQRRSSALAAVSSRRGLMARVRRILTESRREPTLGARWTFAVCLGLLATITALALAQARPAKAKADDEPKADQAALKTLRGKVVAPDGKPLPGAEVVWMGNRKPPLPLHALPRGSSESEPRLEMIAQARTGDDGAFELKAPFLADNYVRYNGVNVRVMVVAPGFGLLSEKVAPEDLDRELTLQVPEQLVIHGRLLAPGGGPAAGVSARLAGFDDETGERGMYVGYRKRIDELPASWPRPRTTDADGRFTIEGVPVGSYATLIFEHPDYAVDEVTVNAFPDGRITPSLRAFEITPVAPTFTHALQPARPVAGRVIDKETGEPLAGVFIRMAPMRRHGGQFFPARTGADGRYRVSGHAADRVYIVTAFPDADSGYLGAEANREWSTGADVLTVDFALEKGRLVHGRVVDQDSGQPVAGAGVVYQPERGNPSHSNAYDLRNPVVTDANGRFTLTVLSGEGVILAEAPSDTYIRTPVEIVNRLELIHPHGFAKVEVPKEGEAKPVEIVVRKGVPIEARLVDPDGKPVESVTAMYLGIDAQLLEIWNVGQEFPNGEFRIPGADPERTYRVFFTNVDRRLGTVAELKYDPTKTPREVRLQPTAAVRGKLAMPGGGPLPEGSGVYLDMFANPTRDEHVRENWRNQKDVQIYANVLGQGYFDHNRDEPRPDGSFERDALIPGVGFIVIGYADGRYARVPVWDLKPGEVRDLGVVTLDQGEGR